MPSPPDGGGPDERGPGAYAPGFLDVAAIDLHLVSVPLRQPFTAAHGTEADRRVVLVRVVGGDGVEGWGECSTLSAPTYTSEWTDGAWVVLGDGPGGGLARAMVWGQGAPPSGQPMAGAAVDAALHDLVLRRLDVPLAAVLGAERDRVPTTAVVGRTTTLDDLVVAVDRASAGGRRPVKLKLAPGWDAGPVAAVRSTWPALEVAGDANGSYDPADPATAEHLDGLGLAYVEQPGPAGDREALADLAGRMATPVALDESIGSPEDAAWWLDRRGPAVLVNVKPARLGGLDAAVAVHDLLVDRGADGFVGGMLETGVGRAAAVAVAALPGFTRPTDLGPSSRYFADDVTAPIELDVDGRLPVPPGPGLGVTPRPDRLAEVTEAVRHLEP